MTGTDSFLPSGVLKLNREYGCVVWVTFCCPMGRTGSIANVRPDSLATVRDGSLATACVGSLATTCAGSLLTGGFGFLEATGARFFVIAFIGLSAGCGAPLLLCALNTFVPFFFFLLSGC